MQSSDADEAILIVENLCVTYFTDHGATLALQNVTLSVQRGARVAIVGESGSGKSTLGLAIAGFLNGPTVKCRANRVEFAGRAIPLASPHRLPVVPRGISMVFQDAMTSLDPVWSIGSQIVAIIRRNKRSGLDQTRRQACDWLARVGLRNDQERILRARPYELSGGMRQRAMLAIALCAEPKLLIADEPTSALDASLSREVMELLTELTASLDTTLLLISHDIELCQDYADRIIVMNGGRIVEEGLAAMIRDTATHPYAIGLLNCVPTLETIGLARLPTMEQIVG